MENPTQPNIPQKATFVQTELKVKATAELKEQVDQELNIPDPSPEQAKAVFAPKAPSSSDKVTPE
tara:strand:- start:396 stop:590 length:195 start_codon:yes stop_codon:yes gene_type:complete